MREIKFRGLTLNGQWVYGLLAHIEKDGAITKAGWYISNSFGVPYAYAVRPETVGQYIDIKDKNGKEVYEGDGVQFVGGTCDLLPCSQYSSDWHKLNTILIVRKLDSGFTLSLPKHIQLNIPNLVGNVNNYDLWNHSQSLEVIGNIYENPELLK